MVIMRQKCLRNIGRLLVFPAVALLVWVFALSALSLAADTGEAGGAPTDGKAATQERVVYHLRIDGVVSPVMAEFIGGSIDRAAEAGAEALVIELDTPGGLDLSMRIIVKKFFASEVPVLLYVSPPGSRAASAGVFLAYAAHVSAMAPGTNIGSASPVALGGEKMDETMRTKVENDAVAYIRSIAAKRGRNADWAEKAVRESVNISAAEAARTGVVDLTAPDLPSLLDAVDGRKVELAMTDRVLATKGARVQAVEMGIRHRVLDAISNPNVAYILMMIGLIGLYFELSNPGAIFPGVIGAVCLVLAFYSFQTLSVNYAGLLLIGLAVIFFFIELSVVSFGLLTIAGVVSLVLGSMMLFDSPAPFMQLSVHVVWPMIALMVAFVGLTMYLAFVFHRRRPVSGVEGMVGALGSAIEDFVPKGGGWAGHVLFEGEYWDAKSKRQIRNGDPIRIRGIDGLVLRVRPDEGDTNSDGDGNGDAAA